MMGDASKQLIALNGQLEQNKISTFAKTVAAATQESMKYMENQEKILQGQLDEITTQEKLVGILQDQDFIKKQSLERDILIAKQARENLTIQSKLGVIEKLKPGTAAMAERLNTSDKRKGLGKEQLEVLAEYDAAIREKQQQEERQTQETNALNTKLAEEALTRRLKGLELIRVKETNAFELDARNANFLLSIEQKSRALSIESLGLRKELGSITQEEYLIEKSRLDQAQVSVAYDQQRNEINQKATRELRDQQKIIDEIQAKQAEKLPLSALEVENLQNAKNNQAAIKNEQVRGLELAKKESTVRTEIIAKTADLATRTQQINRIAQQNQRANELSYQQYKLNVELVQQQINYQNQYLEGRKSVGLLLDSEYVLQKGIIEQRQLDLNLSSKLSEINKAELDTTAALRTELENLNATRQVAGADQSLAAQAQYQADKTYLESKIQLEANRATQARTNLEAEISLQKLISKLKAEQDELQAKQIERMGRLVEVTGSLAAVFGKVGEAIGKSVEKSQELADKNTNLQTKYKADIALAEKRWAADGDGAKGFASDKMKIDSKLAKDQQKLDNENALMQVGNVKKLFKEKTVAYKAISALETALHVARLIQLATEATAEGALTITSIGNSLARAGAKGLEAITSAFAMTPQPLGFIAGAAMTTIIAGILGSAFKGGSKTSFAGFQMNSQQRQETQGTGTTYIADENSKTGGGKKVETGAGVFGDSSAKVDSIRKGIELIAENSVAGLSYDNQMLKALNRLSDAMTGAAQQIYSIPGLRQGGTTFGTQPGTATTAKGGLFGTGFMGSVFGGKTTSTASVQSAGIQLTGTFDQVINDTANSIKQYKDVLYQFHKSGGWFSSSKDWTEIRRETEALQAEVSNSIADIFKESKTLFQTIAQKAGISAATVTNAFSSMSAAIDVDITNLTGQDLIDALNAAIGVKLDEVGRSIFSTFEGFKRFGESFLDTVIRVVDTNDKINQALANIRTVNPNIGGRFDITEALAKTAGGLDKFLDRAEYFRENFLTEAEKLAPIQKAVDTEMSRLGFSSVKTTEQFKYLIQNFKLTDQASYDTYIALLNVAEGFKQVYSAGKDAAAIESERASLQEKIDQLTMTSVQLREKEIAKLSTANQVYQRQINAIMDQQAAAKAYQSALQNVGKTLTAQITSLNDYKNALMSSSNSTLTATEQYSRAKAEVESLVATIKSSTSTAAEKNSAIGKLSTVTDRFLGLSRELFASGAQYSTDFNTVLDTVADVTTVLETQKTDAQRQLDELQSSNTFLSTIDESTKTTAELLQTYLDTTATLAIANAAASSAATTTTSTASTVFAGNASVYQPGETQQAIGTPVVYNPVSGAGMYNPFNAGYSAGPDSSQAAAPIVEAINNMTSQVVTTLQETAAANVDATNNNTQVIAGTVADTSSLQVTAARLNNRAVASYKLTDLNVVDQ
jgi:hypothetical protein